jgi:DNA-binding NarL/FixJ family response regulator
LTEGSPLFLRHLLDGEVSSGRFTPASGIWRWTSEPAISPELADLLEREIGGLDATVQDVVDLVALAEPVAVTTVCALASPESVEQAEARGLVRTDGHVARLAHPLYGEVRRAAMGTVRSRRLRGLVAQTLDAEPDPIPRAVLTLDSDLPPDPALFLRAAEAATGLFDLPLAERLARAAATTGDPVARLVHAAALSWLSRGEEAEEILRDIAETPDPGLRAFAELASAVSAAAAVTTRPELLDEAAVVGGLSAGRVPTVVPAFGLADFQVLGHRLAGTPRRAADQAAAMQAASADLPGPARLMGLVVAGHAALAGGRVCDALPLLREAWAALAGTAHEFRFRCRTLLAIALGQAGDAESAAPLVSGLAAEHHPAYTLFLPDDLLARTWCAAAGGAQTEARDHAFAAADLAREAGSRAYEVLAWQTAVQLGEPTSALSRLTVLAGLSPRAEVALAHARALADVDGKALLEAATAWDRLGDLVAASDAAAQAADVHRLQGRQGSALTAASLAERLAGRSGAHTPALAVAARPLPLTVREREIAALAARGLSNKEIAERLTVSVRTVEGHLYRAGHKLGVSERAAFRAVLGVE